MKRFFAVALTLVLLFGLSVPALAEDPPTFTVTNPYEDVDWSKKPYKVNLHTHTTFSDGNMNLDEVVEEYYAQGYHGLAITDHGVVGKAWDTRPLTVPPLDIQNWFKQRNVLSSERLAEIIAGDKREDGIGMTPVLTGIEANAAVTMKNHVNCYFAEWGQGWIGIENDYRTPIKMTEKNGGVSFINHPGDWADDVNDVDTINFFADILRDYDSCLGIEVYNRVDTVTRHDRTLWNNLLDRLAPEGVQVLGFANDDSHKLSDIGGTAEIMYMKDNSVESIRECMETGAFLASSRYDRIVLGDGDAYVGDREEPFPSLTRVRVLEDGRISLNVADTDEVVWITDGGVEVIKSTTVDLNDPKIKSYVRAQLTGPGGISLTQPFLIDKGDGYKHEDDTLKGWDLFVWYVKMYWEKNPIAWAINGIMGLFD